jgi:uncharacterized protein involved in type VI secretion and phage assembly
MNSAGASKMNDCNTYYGKYRGTVINNVDPMQLGRLQVQVVDVTGLVPGTWAMPCLPFAGKQMGAYMIPQIGQGVWVEFEQGDSDFPIWTGCWLGSPAEPPALAIATSNPLSPSVVLQTAMQNLLLINDSPGTSGVLLKSATGASISVTDAGGILIQSGRGASILVAGPTVTINAGALVIT